MGWTEFGRVRNNYEDEFKKIDDKLLALLYERKAKANGKRFFPPLELMEEWAEKYEMELPQISWFFHSLAEGRNPFEPDGPGELLNVLPIMKKTVVGDFQYVLTHAMQHENGSILTIEIDQVDKEKILGMVHPHLMLEVAGPKEYHTSRHGSHGYEGHTQVEFLVTPRLPDQLNEIEFALIPYSMPMEERPKEVILDKEVYF